jgi:hypothetical protein
VYLNEGELMSWHLQWPLMSFFISWKIYVFIMLVFIESFMIFFSH